MRVLQLTIGWLLLLGGAAVVAYTRLREWRAGRRPRWLVWPIICQTAGFVLVMHALYRR